MASGLTLERVRSDIDVISRAGLDTPTFLAELEGTLQRAVPSVASCMCTVDPATRLLTATYKFVVVAGDDDHDHEWALMEFGRKDPTSFIDLIDRDETACAVSIETAGDTVASPRLRDFLRPEFGFTDELRMVGRDGDRSWGGVALFRENGDTPFNEDEVSFVASLSKYFAAGLRSGLLTRLTRVDSGPVTMVGPAIIIVDADDRPTRYSMDAESLLAELASETNMASAAGIVGALVASARRSPPASRMFSPGPGPACRVAVGWFFTHHRSPAPADRRARWSSPSKRPGHPKSCRWWSRRSS